MDFAVLILLLLVALFLIVISLLKQSILFGVVGGAILFLISVTILFNGIDYPTGNVNKAILNVTTGDTLSGDITSTNTITNTNMKDSTTSAVGLGLFLMSISIMYFISVDYRQRGRE